MSAPAEIRVSLDWGGGEPMIVRWLVADRAPVKRGQAICEIEASKATADIVSPADGILVVVIPDGDVRDQEVVGHIHAVGEALPLSAAAVERGPEPDVEGGTHVPRSLRKAAEIRTLEEGRRGSLPSTVMQQLVVGDLVDRLRDGGASLTALVILAVARALRKHRAFNASASDTGVLLHDAVRIGVALDVEPHGLRVPIVTDADTKTVAEIAGDLQILLYKYMTKTLEPDEIRGATFTLTDLSSFGVAWSVPLLVGRQAAILGLGMIRGADPRDTMLTFSLTFDHRVASGREAALFLSDVRKRISEHMVSNDSGA
ncbi:MAG: 2-oxo acid dehydrogenase subunit E2 [Chloroflexi bacterium]|nr:2-oxo acid dehydrogenase subunit E2 [Chloroflexota bacterium]